MPRIALAAGAYDRKTVGLPDKVCENAYVEKSGTQPDAELQVVTRPGSLKLPDRPTLIRGVFQADGFAGGKILIVCGAVLYQFDPATKITTIIPGAIAGADRVRGAFTETQFGLLANGQPYFSDGITISAGSDGPLTAPGLAIGSTTTNIANAAFTYSLNYTTYSQLADAAGFAPGTDVVPLGKYGAVGIDLDAAGTRTLIRAEDNATGYDSAAAALQGLPGIAANHIRIGVVTVTKSDGAFTFGTTALNAANTTVTYTDILAETDFAALLEDHDQTAFTDITAIGQRFILTYGSRFCFTDVLNGFSITALNFYTAEYAPDGLVGCAIFGERLWLFGTSTIETWEQTTSSDDPFLRSTVISVGCLARDTIACVDTVPYWVDQNNQCRRAGNAVVPDIISGDDVSALIEAENASDLLGFFYLSGGHAFYGIRGLNSCPINDPNYVQWTRFKTNLQNTWRYGYVIRVGGQKGKLYVADAAGVGFAIMDKAYKSEHMPDADTMGTEIVGRVSGYILTSKPRRMGPLRWEGSKGIGLANGQGSDPQILMRRSLKGAGNFTNYRSKSIGKQGEYDKRVIWNQMGQITPPGCAIELEWSDPVAPVTAELWEDG